MVDGERTLRDRRAFRRDFLALVVRRQRPGAGSNLAALDRRTIFMEWWHDAERALPEVPHAVAGAVAANAYAPERSTRDLDMIVVSDDVARAEAALQSAGWKQVGRAALVAKTSWQRHGADAIDLIELCEPWAPEAMAAAQQNPIVGMPTLPLPYLVLMKLNAARAIDLADVSRMLGRAGEDDLRLARQALARYGDARDLEDFEQLLTMGRLERGLDRSDP